MKGGAFEFRVIPEEKKDQKYPTQRFRSFLAKYLHTNITPYSTTNASSALLCFEEISRYTKWMNPSHNSWNSPMPLINLVSLRSEDWGSNRIQNIGRISTSWIRVSSSTAEGERPEDGAGMRKAKRNPLKRKRISSFKSNEAKRSETWSKDWEMPDREGNKIKFTNKVLVGCLWYFFLFYFFSFIYSCAHRSVPSAQMAWLRDLLAVSGIHRLTYFPSQSQLHTIKRKRSQIRNERCA